MAGFNNYQMFGQQPYYQTMQPYQQMQFAQQQTMQRQNEFVRVRSKDEAQNYPVAPNNSITFIDEAAPYCYVKTMGASQLDRPIFEVYRLVKEGDDGKTIAEGETQLINDCSNLKNDIEKIYKELDSIKDSIKTLKDKKQVKKMILQEAEDE